MVYQPLSISSLGGGVRLLSSLPSKTSKGLLLCPDEGYINPSGNGTPEGRMEKVKAVSHDKVATGRSCLRTESPEVS